MVSKRAVIFGGSGFLGRAIASTLGDEFRVVVADNFSRNHRAQDSRIEVVECDVLDRDTVFEVTKGADIVVNLAFINGTRNFYSRPREIASVAVRGQINVIDASNAHNVESFVYASSSEVYQTPSHIPTCEDVGLVIPDIKNPRYSYGGGKIIGEYLTKYFLKPSINSTIFRPHNIYGPHMGFDHVIPELCLKAVRARAKNVQNIEVIGSLDTTRSFCFIDDFASAFNLLVTRNFTGTVNIGSGVETSISEVLAVLSDLLEFEFFPVPSLESHAGSASRRCPDITILESLGFVPKTPLREGLQAVLRNLSAEV